MSKRDLRKELMYEKITDTKGSKDSETISYYSLMCVLSEVLDRIEQLENKWNRLEKKHKKVSVEMGSILKEMESIKL